MSSHTEPDIVQKTEAITSYGYIVKSSNITVYDASIKMAFKLFEAKKKTLEVEKILKTALDNVSEAVFISDAHGRLIDFNNAFATIQGFTNKCECLKKLEDYPALFDVYTADGEFAVLDDWALPRALRGEKASNVKYYIKRKDIHNVWVVRYNYGAISDENGKIIGAVVTIKNVTDVSVDDIILERLRQE